MGNSSRLPGLCFPEGSSGNRRCCLQSFLVQPAFLTCTNSTPRSFSGSQSLNSTAGEELESLTENQVSLVIEPQVNPYGINDAKEMGIPSDCSCPELTILVSWKTLSIIWTLIGIANATALHKILFLNVKTGAPAWLCRLSTRLLNLAQSVISGSVLSTESASPSPSPCCSPCSCSLCCSLSLK